jgi:type IV pilus biogenesis protein PilP
MRPLVEMSIAILAGALAAPPAASQSIAEYSHAQRALLESSMTQAAARVAALAASSAGPLASAPSTPTPAAAPGPSRPVVPTEASLAVDGVFTGGARALAEVVVDGHAYLLAPGQAVPGTAWHVAEITVDRVVLSHPAATGAAAHAPRQATKTFTLPAPAPSRAPAP